LGARRDPLGICAWRSVAHRILVRVELPFILHWFKYRLPAITNAAGRLSSWMLGKIAALGKWETGKSWQAACSPGTKSQRKIRQEIERIGYSIALKPASTLVPLSLRLYSERL
jgi:hypothetical protein